MLAPLGAQQAINGRRANLQQLRSGAGINFQFPEVLQAPQHLRHDRHQSLPTNEIQNHPDPPQRLQHVLIIVLPARRPPTLTDHWSLVPTSLLPIVA